jgi:hypothetical protein
MVCHQIFWSSHSREQLQSDTTARCLGSCFWCACPTLRVNRGQMQMLKISSGPSSHAQTPSSARSRCFSPPTPMECFACSLVVPPSIMHDTRFDHLRLATASLDILRLTARHIASSLHQDGRPHHRLRRGLQHLEHEHDPERRCLQDRNLRSLRLPEVLSVALEAGGPAPASPGFSAPSCLET